MKLTYDRIADAAYLYFEEPLAGMSKETVPLLPEQTGGHWINFDLGADGRLVGIEILDASKVLSKAVLERAEPPRPARPKP